MSLTASRPAMGFLFLGCLWAAFAIVGVPGTPFGFFWLSRLGGPVTLSAGAEAGYALPIYLRAGEAITVHYDSQTHIRALDVGLWREFAIDRADHFQVGGTAQGTRQMTATKAGLYTVKVRPSVWLEGKSCIPPEEPVGNPLVEVLTDPRSTNWRANYHVWFFR